jgi:hypothetical protein
MRTRDDEQDAVEILSFFIGLADQDATLVSVFLQSAGIEPGTSFPRDALIKLGIHCRLGYWAAIGIAGSDKDDLPSAHEVFEDALREILGETPRFPTVELCRRVHLFALRRLTWPQTSGTPSFMLQDQSDPSAFLDSIAEFLWDHRDLGTPEANSRPATIGAISTPKSSAGADRTEQ